MLDGLKGLDEFLQNSAQRVSDKFSQSTGKTKFFLQKWSLIMGLIFFWWRGFASGTSIIGIGILVTATAFGMGVCYLIEKEEAAFLENGKIWLNQWWNNSPIRILFTVFLVANGIMIMISPANDGDVPLLISVACLIAWVYSSICVPRPPAQEKRKTPVVSDVHCTRLC